MSKIDTVKIQSNKTWVDLGTKNIEEITISNRGTVDTVVDFALGPNSLVNTSSDTSCVYFLKDIEMPLNATLVLNERWLFKTFSAGMTIYTNSTTLGVLTRTEMSNPRFLIRTGDTDPAEAVDLIILRK
jgi:hypothetical protein